MITPFESSRNLVLKIKKMFVRVGMLFHTGKCLGLSGKFISESKMSCAFTLL